MTKEQAKEQAIARSIQSLRDHCRVDQKAYSTEKTYVIWSKQYISFLYDSSELIKGLTSEKKFEIWLTNMAMEGCAAATQSQAFNAILCLYKHVFKTELKGVNALRPKRRKTQRHAPSVADISSAFRHVQDTSNYPSRLILHLLYGCGLRVGEGISLRIKDIDFNNGFLFIHDSKHGKDRYVSIPESLVSPLRHQVEVAAMKARIDIATGLLFFAVAKLTDLKTAALVGAAVGLAIVVERRILKVVLRKIANEAADELESIVLVIGQVVGIA